jgi:hypothetical protein
MTWDDDYELAVEEIGRGLFEGSIPAFAWRDRENPHATSQSIAHLPLRMDCVTL